MRFDIITLFPEIMKPYFLASILKRAQEKRIIKIKLHQLRDFTTDKHKTVDDKPYGGGAGMVLKAEPVLKAVEGVRGIGYRENSSKRSTLSPKPSKIIILSAKGKQFNQKTAYDWAKKYKHLILISGRYEGVDERVKKILKAEEISIGPYVLTDGDVAAMIVVSSVARLVTGVIKIESLQEESHWNLILKRKKNVPAGSGLEYPHYTRPEVINYKGKKYKVPPVLLEGNHKKIAEWRKFKQK